MGKTLIMMTSSKCPRHWPFVRGIHRWIPLTKASDTELYFIYFYLRLNILLSKQSRRRWYRAYFDITVIFPLQSITLFIWFNHRHMAINDIVPEIHHKWTFYCYLLSCPIALIVHFNYLWYIHNEADSFITSLNICYWSMECYFGEERS